MTLQDIAQQMCRMKECEEFPLKWKTDVERMIHALNYTRDYYKDFECPVCHTHFFRVDMEDIKDIDEEEN